MAHTQVSPGGAPPSTRPRLAAGPFIRHYIEMAAAMAVGMVAFGILFMSPMDPFGARTTISARPLLSELGMLAAMSLPMAGWMLYRGHSAERTAEMVAGMAVPSLAVIALAATATIPGLETRTVSVWSHVAMLLGMLAAMLLRRTEYATPHGAHAAHAAHQHAGPHGG